MVCGCRDPFQNSEGKRVVPKPLFIFLPFFTCTEAGRTIQGREWGMRERQRGGRERRAGRVPISTCRQSLCRFGRKIVKEVISLQCVFESSLAHRLRNHTDGCWNVSIIVLWKPSFPFEWYQSPLLFIIMTVQDFHFFNAFLKK